MTKQQLIDDFWNAAERTAKGFRLDIAPDCAKDIRAFITTGVNRLEQEGLLGNYRRIAEAETHLIAFIGGMAHEAKQQNFTMLREVTYHAARTSFCPLWPFC